MLFPPIPKAGELDWAPKLQAVLRWLVITSILLSVTTILLGISVILLAVR